MLTTLDALDRLLPPIITLVAVGVIAAYVWGAPYCRYLSLLARANNEEGREKLAKYLAEKTGGRNIDVQELWRSFIPLARDLHLAHSVKRKQRYQ